MTGRTLFYSATSAAVEHGGKPMKSSHLRLVDRIVMRPVASKGRKPNAAYRVREHLTEDEVDKLLAALKANRHGQRDWLIGLLIYRHGLRVSEACDLRWDDLNLAKRTIQVRRLKGRDDSAHYLERDEVAGLKRLQREQEPKSAYVFINERDQLWPYGHWTDDRASWRGCRTPLPHPCAHAQAFDWIRAG